MSCVPVSGTSHKILLKLNVALRFSQRWLWRVLPSGI
jgi:hypothetical protein